jgi:hypothetical protein
VKIEKQQNKKASLNMSGDFSAESQQIKSLPGNCRLFNDLLFTQTFLYLDSRGFGLILCK